MVIDTLNALIAENRLVDEIIVIDERYSFQFDGGPSYVGDENVYYVIRVNPDIMISRPYVLKLKKVCRDMNNEQVIIHIPDYIPNLDKALLLTEGFKEDENGFWF